MYKNILYFNKMWKLEQQMKELHQTMNKELRLN